MVVQKFRDWLENAPVHHLLARPQGSRFVCLARTSAAIFLEIRKKLGMMLHGDFWVDDLLEMEIETSTVGLTPVHNILLPVIKKLDDSDRDLQGMKLNVRQLYTMIVLVFNKVKGLGASTDDTDLRFFFKAFNKVMQQSSAKEFKIQCFRLLTLPMLFTEEEKFCFVYKIYRLSKRREEFYRQRMRMDEDISMYNWALAAMTSSNEAVRNTADFQSKQVPGWDATWRIGPFLRNAIEHIGTVDTTEVEVLNELENMYPQILSKLHFELWNKLLDEKKENDEKDEKDEKDYGYVIHHFQKKPGAFAFIMGLGGDVAY